MHTNPPDYPDHRPAATTQEAIAARRFVRMIRAARLAGDHEGAAIAAILAARSVNRHLIVTGIRRAGR